MLVYTPQLERGYTPDTVVDDHKLKDGPSNANNTYAGKIPLRYAVAHSINTIAWQLYDELTPKAGLQYLKNMNFAQIKDGDYTLATSLVDLPKVFLHLRWHPGMQRLKMTDFTGNRPV